MPEWKGFLYGRIIFLDDFILSSGTKKTGIHISPHSGVHSSPLVHKAHSTHRHSESDYVHDVSLSLPQPEHISGSRLHTSHEVGPYGIVDKIPNAQLGPTG